MDPHTMPTMVSRLPKFGGRASSSALPSATAQTGLPGSCPVPNGSSPHHQPSGVAELLKGGSLGLPSPAKPNGSLRMDHPLSIKWRKGKGMIDRQCEKGGSVGQSPSVNHLQQQQQQQQQQQPQQVSPRQSPLATQRQMKKPGPCVAGKGRGFGFGWTSSGECGPRALPVSKPSPTGSSGQSVVNGHAGIAQPASCSQSSDSLEMGGAVPDRLRSHSLTQVPGLPPPSPTSSLPHSPNITRSYSLNRAAERVAKEPACPSPRPLPKPHLARAGTTTPSLLPTSSLKKLLPPSTGTTAKAVSPGNKTQRPSLIKQPRPLRATPPCEPGSKLEGSQRVTGRRDSVETPSVTPSTTDNSPGSTPESPETHGLSSEPVSRGDMSVLGMTLEDMSLSSTSSLERNDTSQEYIDDFDNLGNGGVGILLLSPDDDRPDLELGQSHTGAVGDKLLSNSAAQAAGLHSFLTDTMDWATIRLSGEQEEYSLNRVSRLRRSSRPDYQGGSSLDLSPSDSCGSGGTYMWDEEGLEPLGSAVTSNSATVNTTTTHPIGSYDSDLNSIDILNNLESCDLDDDDLMLDEDLPEDTSFHSDGDGLAHMPEWRRRQLCWATQDVHIDNGLFQCYQLTGNTGNLKTDVLRDKNLWLGLAPDSSPGLSPGTGVELGLGVDVEELAEDCSAVKAQLEHLQRLLRQQREDYDEELDDTLTADTLSPDSPDTSSSEEYRLHKQVEDLLLEVQQLRVEVRSRDRTISQLTQQLIVPVAPTRCCCQETEMERRAERHTQTSAEERESLSLSHKASQTPWRESTYQRSRPYRGRQRPCIPHRGTQRVENLVYYFSDSACLTYYTPPALPRRAD